MEASTVRSAEAQASQRIWIGGFVRGVGDSSHGRTQISVGYGKTHSIALKIALNESAERRIMGLELEAIEFTWKHEEELAHIIDEELTPDDVRERHLRRLPVTVVQ